MGYLVRAYYSIPPTRYYKDDPCWSADLKSKTTEDIIGIGSFVEVLVLNQYVLVRKILQEPCLNFSPNQFAYPENKLTINEMLAKFTNEGMREHEEIEIFIKEFRTTNKLLLKDQNNLLSELKIEVHQLKKVMSDVLFSRNEVKGVTTRG
ncbi:hypothetical protein Tco_1214152 [Tanacetum coccineum]